MNLKYRIQKLKSSKARIAVLVATVVLSLGCIIAGIILLP